MQRFKTVAVAGGTGDLGSVIVGKLAAAGEFDVRVISRGSAQRFALPPSVSVVTVDYSSTESLTEALRGCDVVVECLSGRTHYSVYEAIVDAAAAAKVDRCIVIGHARKPREEDRGVLDVRESVKRKDLGPKLVEMAANGIMNFTAINVGSWIEYIMSFETMMSMPHRTFYMHENADTELSMCTLASIGDAVVATLRKPAATENQFLYVEVFRVSQNRALQLAREAMPGTEFRVVQANSQQRYARGMAALQAGQVNDRRVYADLVAGFAFGMRNSGFEEPSNEQLGIPRLTEEEFKDVLRELGAADRYTFEISM